MHVMMQTVECAGMFLAKSIVADLYWRQLLVCVCGILTPVACLCVCGILTPVACLCVWWSLMGAALEIFLLNTGSNIKAAVWPGNWDVWHRETQQGA